MSYQQSLWKELKDVVEAAKEVGNQVGDVAKAAKGRKRQDAEFENKIRMKHNAPRILREVTVVGKKNDRDKGPEVGN